MAPRVPPLPGTEWAVLMNAETGESVVAMHDEQVPRFEPESYGTRESVPRPGRDPLTPHRGQAQTVLTFGLFLNAESKALARALPPGMKTTQVHTATVGAAAPQMTGTIDLTNVAPEMNLLSEFGGWGEGDPESPELIVDGALIPYSYRKRPRIRWVVAPGGIEWGDAISDTQRFGDRLTQQVTISLWPNKEAEALDWLISHDPRKQARLHVVAGRVNTYNEIARHVLGEQDFARRLSKLPGNPRKGLNSPHPQGTVIRLPSLHTLQGWRRDRKRRRGRR